jgi:hypothetical protein
MTIGIIVEGQEESESLAHIVGKIAIENVIIRKPLYASTEPKATPGQIAKAVESRLKILKAQQILVLIDLENQDVCPGERAQTLENTFHQKGYRQVQVIIKNKNSENWLIADCDALKQLSTFKLTQAFINQVTHKADHVTDAVGLLTKIKSDKKSFYKTKDGEAIARKANPEKIALHSRSFRRFLRLLGHQLYRTQSKQAAI